MRLVIGLFLALFSLSAFAAEFNATWQPPTTNVDGSPLTDLAGFRVYTSATQGGPYTQAADVTDPLATTGTFSVPLSLSPGDNNVYVVMTAYDAAGNESVYSNEVMKVVSVVDDVAPSAPAVITITITVGVDCPPGYSCGVQ